MNDQLKDRYGELFVFAVFFLFFFQLIADFIEGIYAFGLLGTSIPPELVSVLFLFAPIFLLFWRAGVGKRPYLILSLLVILCRLVEPMLATRGKMLVSGLGTAAWLIWFPALLWRLSRRDEVSIASLAGGLVGGTALSVLFRVLGSGSDVTLTAWPAVGWLLAGGTAVLLARQTRELPVNQPPSASFGRLAPPAIGLVSGLVLLYFAFTSPNVLARWSGASYPAVVALVMAALAGFAGLKAFRPTWLERLPGGLLLAWNGLFLLALMAAILPFQVRFPAAADGYPLPEPAVSQLGIFALYLMILLHPIIYLNFAVFAGDLAGRRPSLGRLAGAFSLASLLLLLLIFGQVFTTVYDYIPVVGPFFRDKFWLVHLAAGLGMALPLFFRSGKQGGRRAGQSAGWPAAFAAGVLVVGAAAVGAVFVTASRPPEMPPKTAVRVLTYNIQQGYSEEGLKNFTGQLDLIRSVDADIIALEESDTNRIAGGNSDVVRTFADALDMIAYYGPKTIPGTFGIALLSKYPIEMPRTFFMYSEGEQTAAIAAQINTGSRTYHVFVTHLGNGGPIVQQEAVMAEVAGKENVILMGDFNFRPDSDPYALTTAVLDDAWLRRWPTGEDDSGLNPADRIDHIFVSPDLQVDAVQYIFSPASDHPAVTAVIGN